MPATQLTFRFWFCQLVFRRLCGPQIRGVQGETSAIFEKGGLQPQERHPLHAMFRTDGCQPEGAHRVLPLVHVSASAFPEPNVFVFLSIHRLFLIHPLVCDFQGSTVHSTLGQLAKFKQIQRRPRQIAHRRQIQGEGFSHRTGSHCVSMIEV